MKTDDMSAYNCLGEKATHVLLQSVKNYEAARHDVPGNSCKRVDSTLSVSSVDDGSIYMADARGWLRAREKYSRGSHRWQLH